MSAMQPIAEKRACRCPLWVKSRHFGMSNRCPLYPRKRTFDRLFDHLVGAGESGLGPLFVERQKRAETQASSASLSVLVMTADPKRAFAILVSTLGHKIKVLIIDVHHVDAAGICRICMKDVPVAVFVEDAHTLAL